MGFRRGQFAAQPAGTLPTPPANFRVHVLFHPDGVLYSWISDGIPGTSMPAWKYVLTAQEGWDLVNFLRDNSDQRSEPGGDFSAGHRRHFITYGSLTP